jgi:pimeloyl-ACP methyl ester carboxylesterase
VRRAYVDTSGGQIHLADEGAGPPLVLLHHAGRSLDYYAPLYPLLTDRFRLIAIDFPGFGGSDPALAPLTIPRLAECVIEVADRLNLPQFYLYGTNTGAAVAMALASAAPERVPCLALMSAPVVMSEAQRQEALATLHAERPVSPDGSELVRYWQVYGMDPWRTETARGHDIPQEAAQDFASSYLGDILRCQSRLREAARATFTFDALRPIARIKAPTLVLALEGESRPTARIRPILRTAAILKELLAKVEIDTLPATHATFANVAVAKEVAASLARFFGQGPL